MKPPREVKVSVIIPTYNRADLILQTIGSVLAQTFTDYEIIVIDDGSTDNTAEILRELIEAGKIQYVWQENKGESAARNHGLRLARGKYIAFLDSDDLWLPQKLEAQVTYLEAHPEAGLAQSAFAKFDDATGEDLGTRNSAWFSGWIYPEILMHWSDLMAVDAVLIPAKVIEHVGGFDETLRKGEDPDLWRRISRHYPFIAMPEVLTKVRVHSGSVSANKAEASKAFRVYLEKAFAEDLSLSIGFRKRTLARMYAYMAYNQIGSAAGNQIRPVLRDSWNALVNFPFEWRAYLSIALSLLPFNLRRFMHRIWGNLRYKKRAKF
ncbi:MAG: glycosyltransferase family 2 protein [Anaerolineales bacterium]|nr:glycosyltransferase family 2 protein [Anaerolineales bacterium]